MASPNMEFIETCTEVDSGRFRCTAIGGLTALIRTWAGFTLHGLFV